MKTLARAFLIPILAHLVWAQAPAAHWVATWVSAQQQPRVAFAPPIQTAAPGAPSRPALPPNAFNNQTVRMIVRSSIGGSRVRVELSNAFGAKPLAVGAAHIALRSKDSAIVAGTDRALTFNGKASTTIPAGAVMLSDAVDLDVPKLADLAVSLYVSG